MSSRGRQHRGHGTAQRQIRRAVPMGGQMQTQLDSRRIQTWRDSIDWMGVDRIPQHIRGRSNEVHDFVQSTAEIQLPQTYPGFSNAPYYFSLSQLDQAASWSAIFDQFRIAQVEVTIRPQYNTGQTGVGAVNWYTIIDYDDANPVASAAGMREYNNCMISGYETQVRTFTPHAAIAAYTGAFGGFANVTAPWLDVASATIQHYGLKVGIDPGSAAPLTPQVLILQFKYRMQFRNIH